MPEHLKIGKEGEDLATEFLLGKNYEILERNWRNGHRELDIIARSGDELIIVEVKVRKFIGTERLEEHIPPKKQKRLIRSAAAYLALNNLDLGVRFDIILLRGARGEQVLEHIKDAFSAWDHS